MYQMPWAGFCLEDMQDFLKRQVGTFGLLVEGVLHCKEEYLYLNPESGIA